LRESTRSVKTVKRVQIHPAADASDVHTVEAEPIAPAVAQRLASVFKSLSDPTRLRIISMVSDREFCVSDLVAALEMEQSTVSHQLRDMRRLGLVSFRREGRHVFYRLDDSHVRNLFEQGLAHSQE
jgi:ArsR family transcriptional regulator, lead/cadmium/zinc/bismuth-responsive transcriptional repressor